MQFPALFPKEVFLTARPLGPRKDSPSGRDRKSWAPAAPAAPHPPPSWKGACTLRGHGVSALPLPPHPTPAATHTHTQTPSSRPGLLLEQLQSGNLSPSLAFSTFLFGKFDQVAFERTASAGNPNQSSGLRSSCLVSMVMGVDSLPHVGLPRSAFSAGVSCPHVHLTRLWASIREAVSSSAQRGWRPQEPCALRPGPWPPGRVGRPEGRRRGAASSGLHGRAWG